MFVAEPEGTIMPLVLYWPLWGIIALTLVLIVAAWYLYAFLSTRPKRPAPAPNIAPATLNGPQIQAKALQRVDSIEQEFIRGELSPRRAHAAISAAVRDYVAEMTGVPADRMMLEDLQYTQLHGTAHTIGSMYPTLFGTRQMQSVPQSANAARSVITQWL